jgi:predicted dehydrogenase
MARVRLAVVGVGHLGKEHARILAGLPDVELVGVVDANAEQARAVAGRCHTQAFTDPWPLLPRIDAAVIAVPTSQHYSVATHFLRRGISLLVEKPLASTLEQADELVELADRQGVRLQVGHIERFNPAFEELARRPLQPKFIECERCGPFSGRSLDIGVVLDLMIHDLDLLRTLVGASVESVEAVGVSLFGQHEDSAHARLRFANGCLANVTASRTSPTAVRRMRVWAPEGFAGVDFARRRLTLAQPSPELRRPGWDVRLLDPAALGRFRAELFGRHVETLEIDCDQGDQLTRELQDFVACVRTGDRPRVNGEDGREAMALAMRVLDRLRTHRWDGSAAGPAGPTELPMPLGPLFPPGQSEAAA